MKTIPSHNDILSSPIIPPHNAILGNIAQQNFNPGNLLFAGQSGAVRGAPKPGGGFWAKFPNEAAGYTALQNDIQAKVGRNPKMTVAQLLDLRSPPSENNTSALHYNVMDSLKDLRDSGKIHTLMANQLPVNSVPIDRLAQAIAQAEGYKSTNIKMVASGSQ